MALHYRQNSVPAVSNIKPRTTKPWSAENVRYELPKPRRRQLKLAVVVACLVVALLWRLSGVGRRKSNVRWAAEKDATGGSQCDKVTFHALAELPTSERMSLYTFVNGQLVADDTELHAPQSICIIAAIPQTPPTDLIFRDLPVPGKGPDTIHLILKSSSVTLTFPPLRPLPGQVEVQEQLASHPILYSAEATLLHNGTYEFSAEREWANWRWAKQYHEDLDGGIFFHDTGFKEPLFNLRHLTEAEFLDVQRYPDPVSIGRDDMHPPSLRVAGPNKISSRPLCNVKNLATHGRWYKASDFPDHSVAPWLVDNWGYIWEGDDCRLEYYSDVDEFDCFAGKNIHLYGASNARRMGRTILSGSRWCHDYDDVCQTNDQDQPLEQAIYGPGGVLWKHERSANFSTKFKFAEYTPFDFGNSSRLYYSPLRSASLMPHDWLRMLYDPADYHLSARAIEEADRLPDTRPRPFSAEEHILRPGAKARAPTELPPADLVIIIMGGWDQAVDYDFDDYERVLPYFRDALLEAYKDVPIILRLSTGYCCRRDFWDASYRRLTGGRVQHMLDQFRAAFKVEGTQAMDGRIGVWDPSFMYGRPEVVEKDNHPSNHPVSTHIRVEMQMLLNSVCRRDRRSGKAQLKGIPADNV